MRVAKSTAIPRLHLNIEQIAMKAERLPEAFVYDSAIRGAYLMRRQDTILVITENKGYIEIKKDDVPALVEELQNIVDDMKAFR